VRHFSAEYCCREEAICVPQYECVFVALVTQHAIRMPHIILPNMACLAIHFFPRYLKKRHDFLNKK
jgi:hypothetical protein